MDEKTETGAPAVGEFSDELRRLGRQLAEAAKAAWESEPSRHAQTQLREGLADMTRQLEEAARKVQTSEESQKLRQQAERVVESARKSDVAEEMRQGLLTGLRDLNAALEKAVTRLRDEKPADKQS